MNNKKYLLICAAVFVFCFGSGCNNGMNSSEVVGAVPPLDWTFSFNMFGDKLGFSGNDPDDLDDPENSSSYSITYGDGRFVLGGTMYDPDMPPYRPYFIEEDDDEWEGSYGRDRPFTWYSDNGGKTWNKGSFAFNNHEDNVGYRSSGRNSCVSTLGFGDGTFVAGMGSEGHISYSLDGINWIETEGFMGRKNGLGSIIYGNKTFIYDNHRWGGIYQYSKDKGRTWEYGFYEDDYFGGSNSFQTRGSTFTFGNGLFYALADAGDETNYYYGIVTSSDGFNWDFIAKDTYPKNLDFYEFEFYANLYNSLMILTYGNGVFIATADSDLCESYFIYSEDGCKTWKPAFCPPEFGAYELDRHSGIVKIVYGNGYFVAVGYHSDWSDGTLKSSGRILYSADNGKSWKTANGQFNGESFNDVSYGNGTFVVVSNTGRIYCSNTK